MTEEVTIDEPIKSRKWGWGYETEPTGEDAYSIKAPSRPDYRGTPKSLLRAQGNDRTYQSFIGGGTYVNAAWFYEGKMVEAIRVGNRWWDPADFWDLYNTDFPPPTMIVRVKQ